MTGLITIRAHQSQDICQFVFDEAQDTNTSARFMFIATNRWFAIWMDLIGAIYISCVTYTCVSLPRESIAVFITTDRFFTGVKFYFIYSFAQW
jgi:hypothetical protein